MPVGKTGADINKENSTDYKIPGTEFAINGAKAKLMLNHLNEGAKYAPDKFKDEAAFLAAYGAGKPANEVAFLKHYYATKFKKGAQGAAGTGTPSAIVSGNMPSASGANAAGTGTSAIGKPMEAYDYGKATAAVAEGAKDSEFNDITSDAFGDEAKTTAAKFTELEAAELKHNNEVMDLYGKLDDETRAAYEKEAAEFERLSTEARSMYGQIKEFQDTIYKGALDEMAKRQAGQASAISGKLSGAGISDATVANAMAEIRNSPKYAAEQNAIVTNYVNNLNGTVEKYNSILSGLASNRIGLTEKGAEFKKGLIGARDALMRKVTDIKKE